MEVDIGRNSFAVDEESHFLQVHDDVAVENCIENDGIIENLFSRGTMIDLWAKKFNNICIHITII